MLVMGSGPSWLDNLCPARSEYKIPPAGEKSMLARTMQVLVDNPEASKQGGLMAMIMGSWSR